MEELILPICLATSFYNGLYLELDSDKYYLLRNKQYIIESKRKKYQLPLKRLVIKNKTVLIKEYYENE